MSNATVPIYRGEDFYVPYFELKLRGRPLQQDVVHDVVQVTYKDNVTDIDSFEVTINNWDGEQRRLKYSDDHLFDPGAELELWMGYYGKERLRLMVTGEITSLRPSFPAAGQPTLAVSGLNLLHRLRTEQRSQSYIDKTDSEIAEEIAARLKVALLPEKHRRPKEPPYPYMLQENAYDIVFLMDRARRVGYDLFLQEVGESGKRVERKLYFGPSTSVTRPTYRLEYGRSLIEFQPNLSTANQVGEVLVRGWDGVKKKPIRYTAKRSELATTDLGGKGVGAIDKSFADRKEVVVTRLVDSEDEARKLATQTLELIAKGLVTGTGSVVGVPDLRAGSVIVLSGLGERFSGRYFVTETTHSIGDSGYTTQFGCRREEVSGGQ